MTYKDKFIKENPDKVFNPYEYCPTDVSLERTHPCSSLSCEECWNREIPGTPDTKTIESAGKDHLEGFLDGVGAHIKDSGDRTEFSTGAVRDMREGKGRCDLMPLEVVAEFLILFHGQQVAAPVNHIAWFKKSGDTKELYLSLYKFCMMQPDWNLNPTTMFLEVSKHFEEGAKKYGENNWQKGIPVNCYIDSSVRHYLKWLRGDKDEPHDRAFIWNLMCCIWEVDYHNKED